MALETSSCRTTPKARFSDHPGINRRIKKHFLKFDELSEHHKEKVRHGEIVEGMSKDAVYLAWGKANRVRQSSRHGHKTERWEWFDGEPVHTGTIGYGTGGPVFGGPWGGPGWEVGSDVHVVDVLSRSVEFANDRVVAWDRER